MKHIALTVLLCLDVAAFSALYRRTTEIVVQALLEGLSQISVFTECLVPRDLIRTSLDAGVHKFTVRGLG
jgi:hypothetical protein